MANANLSLHLAGTFSRPEADTERVTLANDVDPREVSLIGISVVELQFPKFVDGRAFSQAVLLRTRLGFAGEIRAIGDVLVDQLQQMQRTGFSQAVLRDDQSLEAGQRQLERFAAFYQGDVVQAQPHFSQPDQPVAA